MLFPLRYPSFHIIEKQKKPTENSDMAAVKGKLLFLVELR